jgi:hypothetical protein
MFLLWIIGLSLMILSGFLFYKAQIKYGIPYEKFHFENSNEFGVLQAKDWDEYVKFRKFEAKSQVQDYLIGKPLACMFILGWILFFLMTAKFIFRF